MAVGNGRGLVLRIVVLEHYGQGIAGLALGAFRGCVKYLGIVWHWVWVGLPGRWAPPWPALSLDAEGIGSCLYPSSVGHSYRPLICL